MGLITEASPLNFPEGASLDEENFVLLRDGSRRRRFGMGFESGYSLCDYTIDQTSMASMRFSNYLWENVAEDPQKNILVHQFGNRLFFFDANLTAGSTTRLFGGGYISLTATIATRFSFASIQGDLIVAVGDQYLRRINYEGTATASVSYYRLKVRDFWGVDDGYGTDERPSGTLSSSQGALHAYNLYNQGWPPLFFCATEGTANPSQMNNGVNADPVSHTMAIIGQFPSNADNIYSAMTFFTSGRKAYFPWALQNVAFGNTPTAKGHYIIDLFDRSGGRSAAYTQDVAKGFTKRFNYTSYLKQDQSTGGVKAVAAYAGRIFYACTPGEVGGDQYSPHVGTFVLFSQLVDSSFDLEKCYQEADPTAEDISDLIDTDGGYIQIPDAVNIKALVPFSASLLIFADNGVWELMGGQRGFVATEYQTKFLTNNGAINADSIITTPEGILYWGKNGIYAIGADQTGNSIVQSITEKTIQTYYNDIPYTSKLQSVGYYDDVNYRARWLFQESTLVLSNIFSHELILDLSIPAWSKFHIMPLTDKALTTSTPWVTGYIPVPLQARISGLEYKYSCIAGESTSYRMTMSCLNNLRFVDWSEWNLSAGSATSTLSAGIDAAAYLITGYIL